MDVDPKISQESGSYRSILKSTSLIGGASIINILISMVRTKVVAMLLGPNGVGLLGVYGQITGLVGSITRLGIGSSGVRQVAEAVGSQDEERIARTVITLRRTSWLTGGFGLLSMALLCVPLSQITFKSHEYAWPIALLGTTLLTGAIASGQSCIINGTRRIADLAKISIIGALSGTFVSIPCFYFWGTKGIIPSLILTALASLIISWWFALRITIKKITLTWRDSSSEARQLLLLGMSFMGSGLVSSLSGYLINVVMLRQFGLADVGIYQAAFSLSGILVGFVLGAMGSDYYPRLTAAANNNGKVFQMVNEQLQISILLALPGLAAMMIFAPLVIKIFYTASFVTAIPVLRWCTLGILGRVFSWPLGYVMLAKGAGKTFFITEVIAGVVHLGGVFLFTRIWGLNGAGIAFMVLYLIYTAIVLFVMSRLVGSTWSKETLLLALSAVAIMTTLMLNCNLNHNMITAWALNLLILTTVALLCMKELSHKSGISMQALLNKIGSKKNK